MHQRHSRFGPVDVSQPGSGSPRWPVARSEAAWEGSATNTTITTITITSHAGRPTTTPQVTCQHQRTPPPVSPKAPEVHSGHKSTDKGNPGQQWPALRAQTRSSLAARLEWVCPCCSKAFSPGRFHDQVVPAKRKLQTPSGTGRPISTPVTHQEGPQCKAPHQWRENVVLGEICQMGSTGKVCQDPGKIMKY